MALPIPATVIEDKFESYIATDAQRLLSILKPALRDYDVEEKEEGTSPFHRIYGMKLVKVFSAQEFSSKIFVFSVHNYFSKLEITHFSRNREEMKKILSNIHSQLGGRLWDFSFKESVLVSLPNYALGLLFLVLPSLLLGGITLESLLVSGFLLQFILPSLTTNLKGETEKKWKPYTVPIMEKTEEPKKEEDFFKADGKKEKWDWFSQEVEKKVKKKVKKKEEEEEEIAWGHDESDYKWEGVWD